MASRYHLALLNIGRILAPTDSPRLKDFMDGLDTINALAEGSPGFVWRYTAPGTNNATTTRPFPDENILINFAVWQSREQLWDFVYRSRHLEYLIRRREWFEHMAEPFLVLWWIPAGHIPTLEEGKARLDLLRGHGPTPEAFTFRQPFEAPDQTEATPAQGTA
jgi:uncharacterized protein DUF3291